MEVIPAIDLKDGRCVRLLQGDFDKETVFSQDPGAVARRWEQEGAPRIHVVDLDGAASGEPRNTDAVARILANVTVPVQLGGGVRNIERLKGWLGKGVDRVVLGTAAAENESFLKEACQMFGARVVLGVDAKNGWVAASGWTRTTEISATGLVERAKGLGVRRIIYTDIARDGMLSGPNMEGVRDIAAKAGIPVIASGGVSSIEHLKALKDLGVEGSIVGRALYTGDVDLNEAIAAVRR